MRKCEFVYLMPDATNIGYDLTGSGTKILLIHDSEGAEEEIIDARDVLSEQYTVLCPSRRGWDGSGAKGKGYSMDVECSDMIEFMKKYEIENIFGMGYGALIAMHIALRYPVKKMILQYAYLTELKNYDWVSKMKKQIEKNDFWGALATYTKKKDLSLYSFIPGAVLKFCLHFIMVHSSFSYANLIKGVPEDQLETTPLRQTRHQMNQFVLEITAACDSEKELEKLSDSETEILLLSEYSDNIYVKKSIDKIASQNPKFRKVSINLTKPPITPKKEFMKILKQFMP